MKSRSSAQPKRKGGIFLGIVIGLLVGVGVAAGLAYYITRTPVSGKHEAGKAEPKAEAKADTKADPKSADGKSNQPTSQNQPLALPGKPGDKVDDKPRFEFYKILPGKEGAEESKGADKPADKSADKAPKTAGEAFYLQAGAFSKPEDADNLKARLAFMGLEASVQALNVPDKATLHRVRLGPFARQEDANEVKARLAGGGIKADLVKAKD